MALRVIGAGWGRTGTYSLKLGLERLLGGPCYHMAEVFSRPDDIRAWYGAATGDMPDWRVMFERWSAAVDWPAASFWKELSAVYPEAKIVLSLRDPESWWESASQTIFRSLERPAPTEPGIHWGDMIDALFRDRFTTDVRDKDACIAAFNRHNEEVRQTVPQSKLIVWRATEGWTPLCTGLGLDEPTEPFPCANTREQFLARVNKGSH